MQLVALPHDAARRRIFGGDIDVSVCQVEPSQCMARPAILGVGSVWVLPMAMQLFDEPQATASSVD
jgi:hypothetical protein